MMKYLLDRLFEPSTMAGIALVLLGIGVYESTVLGWWRDFIYAAVLFGLAACVMAEK
jgi:hypothetical protein